MSRTTEALEAFIRLSNVKHREVYGATVVCADGQDRLIVRPEGCDVDISVLSVTSIGPGESVTALGPRGADGGLNSNADSVLPSAVRPGASTSSTVPGTGTPFTAPVVIVWRIDGDEDVIIAAEHDAGTGAAAAEIWRVENDNFRNDAKAIVLNSGLVVLSNPNTIRIVSPSGSVQTHTALPQVDVSFPNLTHPVVHQVGGDDFLFWLEMAHDDVLFDHTWQLYKASPADLASAAIENTFTALNEILPGGAPVAGITTPFINFSSVARGGWIAGGLFQSDVPVRYTDGGPVLVTRTVKVPLSGAIGAEDILHPAVFDFADEITYASNLMPPRRDVLTAEPESLQVSLIANRSFTRIWVATGLTSTAATSSPAVDFYTGHGSFVSGANLYIAVRGRTGSVNSFYFRRALQSAGSPPVTQVLLEDFDPGDLGSIGFRFALAVGIL